MRIRPQIAISLLMFVLTPRLLVGAELKAVLQLDSDHDGISDAAEQSLLLQFAPRFVVSRPECSSLQAEFIRGVAAPNVEAENGTIYGQVFPAPTGEAGAASVPTAEIHFYHLWKQDCGAHGHPLDAEHVSVLVQASSSELGSVRWKALYWYAAAHENTVCDVSQIARASTLNAEEHGPTVWISAGKHASFLADTFCARGCGADVCSETRQIQITQLINLGELHRPMNGSLWINSRSWALAAKMSQTDFPAAAIARINSVPSTEIALFNAGRHPMQGTVAISSATLDALATSGNDTASGLSASQVSTGNALRKSYKKTAHALGASARHFGKALRLGHAGSSGENSNSNAEHTTVK